MAGLAAHEWSKKQRPLGGALVLLLLALLIIAQAGSVQADVCSESLTRMVTCRDYVMGRARSVPESCCKQVQALQQSTSGQTQKRRQICSCFKKFASILNARNTAALPKACGVNLGYPISATTDCNRYT